MSSTAILLAQARTDPEIVQRMRRTGRRAIVRGAVIVGTVPFVAVAFFALRWKLSIGVGVALATYMGVALGVGIGLAVIGVSRLLTVKAAERALEAARLPVAQLRH